MMVNDSMMTVYNFMLQMIDRFNVNPLRKQFRTEAMHFRVAKRESDMKGKGLLYPLQVVPVYDIL